MFSVYNRKGAVQTMRKYISLQNSCCISNIHVHSRAFTTTVTKNVWKPSFVYDNKRNFCAAQAAQVLIQEQLSPRVHKLNELFLQAGAPTLDASITCSDLEITLLKMVDGAHDTFTKDIIHQIVSTGDYDKTGTINKEEFFQWFEPIADENLNLQELLKYWSTNSEFKNSKVIFTTVWNALVAELSEEKMIFPAEILCLGGAPGSGKGTNTPFILRERDIDAKPIVMSSLLQSPAMQKIKASGGLVSDNEVLKVLLTELLSPKYRRGAVVDGFPRTAIQVDFLRYLRDQMIQLQLKFSNTPLAASFSRPAFRIIVLYVNETESVRRQLARGKIAMEHNEQVRLSGHGELWELRETDISPAAARKRYKVFSEEALDALQSLKKEFPYHVIDASGTIEQVEKEIMKELAYQSSMELSADTYEAIKDIPTSKSIITNARQRLVQRLDQYQAKETKTFHEIIAVIKRVFVPVLRRHALSGAARVIVPPDDPAHKLLHSSPSSIGMIIDILADRDFSVYAVEEKEYGSMFDVRFQTRTFLHKDDDSA